MIDSSFLTLSKHPLSRESGPASGPFGVVPFVNTLTDFFRRRLHDSYINFYFDRVVNEIDKNPWNASEILFLYGIFEEEDRRKIAVALSLRNPSWVERGLFAKPFEQAIDGVLKEDSVRKIRAVLHRRLSDVESEFARLKEVKRIDRSLKIVKSNPPLTIEEQVALAQSMELREELKSGFYVVNHGENNSGTVVNIVAKKAAELFQSKKHEYFEILRDKVFLQEVPEERDVMWYKKRLIYPHTDHNYRNELISADIWLESTRPYESALHFFSKERNVALRDPRFIPDLLTKILKKHFPQDSFAEGVSNELWEISKNLKGGTLYSICIPKKYFPSIGYLSEPLGVSVDNESVFDLESLQDGVVDFDPWNPVPQVRLLTSKLTEERGVLIIPHSTLPQTEIDKIEQAVQNCLSEAAKRYSAFFDKANLTC